MKQINTTILFLLATLPLMAKNDLFGIDKPKVHAEYSLSLRAGMIMPDGKVDAMLDRKGQWIGPTAAAEFSVTFHPNWPILREWNRASIGVALSAWKFDCTRIGSQDLTGYAIAPYTFLNIPFYTNQIFQVGIRPGLGVSFITKTYFNTATPEQQYKVLQEPGINRSVGSVFNFFFPEALYCKFSLGKGWKIGLAGGWYHMSNGSIRQPNSGYNMFMGELSVAYRPPHREDFPTPSQIISKDRRMKIVPAPTDDRRESLNILRDNNCEIEFAFCLGGRQVYYRDRQNFFCGEAQLSAYWRAHEIFRLGGGVDLFYDASYADHETKYKKTYLSGASMADCWRIGLSVQPEFIMGRFSAGFHFGVYLYDPVKNREAQEDTEDYTKLWNNNQLLDKKIFYKYDVLNAGSAGYPDGWLYTQIVLRYRLPYHIFIQTAMKAHLTKVEFVSAGLGVYL
ncbi:MAG: acyloxyacyl hydrolase [Paludibacteraceae bacterium]|nr:acyloxyacyl hydrolase [Paludibacteraceae bacterium]